MKYAKNMKDMKRKGLFIFALLLIFSTSVCGIGCVKSEASPIYSENSTAGVGEKGAETADVPAGRYEAPEHWTDSVAKDDLSVIVDAKVTVPDAEKFPVTVMSADVEISQEMADNIRKTLLGDKELYWNEPPVRPYTKLEFRELINSVKNHMDTPEGKEYSDLYQTQIDTLENMYEDAPEFFEPGPADTEFREFPETDGSHSYMRTMIRGTASFEDDKYETYLNIIKGKIGGEFWEKGRVIFHRGVRDFWYPADALENPSFLDSLPKYEDGALTMEQAKEQALAAVRAMGLDYLEISDAEGGHIIVYENNESWSPIGVRPCYTFILKRSVGGILENHAIARSIPLPSEQDYEKADLFEETAHITIAKEGVIEFTWGGPGKVVEIESENVGLLSFDETREVFGSQIILDNLQSEMDAFNANHDINVLSRSITIEEARLGLMRVSRQIEGGGYLIIPVWDFYGYESLKLANPEAAKAIQLPVNENGEYVNRIYDKTHMRSYLTLNAIDGSVISRTLGY